MKNYLRYSVLALMAFALVACALVACASPKEEPSQTTQSSKPSETKKTKSEEDILKEQYGTVLEEYYKIIVFSDRGWREQSYRYDTVDGRTPPRCLSFYYTKYPNDTRTPALCLS